MLKNKKELQKFKSRLKPTKMTSATEKIKR